MEENPFAKEGRRANMEIQQRKNNTRRQAKRAAREKVLNASNKARVARQAVRAAILNGQTNVSKLQNNANAAKTAKEEAEAELRNLESAQMLESIKESEDRAAAAAERLPRLLQNMENQSAHTNAFLKNLNAKMANYNRREDERLRALPKEEAISQINTAIATYKNFLNTSIKQKRNNRTYARKYTENMSNEESMGILAAYDPTLDPNSPEAKAMNQVIQQQLKYKKNVRAGTRKLLNEGNANTEREVKQLMNHVANKIKHFEALKKEIKRRP